MPSGIACSSGGAWRESATGSHADLMHSVLESATACPLSFYTYAAVCQCERASQYTMLITCATVQESMHRPTWLDGVCTFEIGDSQKLPVVSCRAKVKPLG